MVFVGSVSQTSALRIEPKHTERCDCLSLSSSRHWNGCTLGVTDTVRSIAAGACGAGSGVVTTIERCRWDKLRGCPSALFRSGPVCDALWPVCDVSEDGLGRVTGGRGEVLKATLLSRGHRSADAAGGGTMDMIDS